MADHPRRSRPLPGPALRRGRDAGRRADRHGHRPGRARAAGPRAVAQHGARGGDHPPRAPAGPGAADAGGRDAGPGHVAGDGQDRHVDHRRRGARPCRAARPRAAGGRRPRRAGGCRSAPRPDDRGDRRGAAGPRLDRPGSHPLRLGVQVQRRPVRRRGHLVPRRAGGAARRRVSGARRGAAPRRPRDARARRRHGRWPAAGRNGPGRFRARRARGVRRRDPSGRGRHDRLLHVRARHHEGDLGRQPAHGRRHRRALRRAVGGSVGRRAGARRRRAGPRRGGRHRSPCSGASRPTSSASW